MTGAEKGIYLLLAIVFNLLRLCNCAVEYPRLNVVVKNWGFHRDLEYSLILPTEVDCDFLIVQNFHQGLYVSNDQLNDLKRMKMIKSYVPSYINVELPMEKATPFTVYLFGSGNNKKIHIKLPIHLRYQSPSHQSFKSIPIHEPKVFLGCTSDTYQRKSNDTFKLPCPSSSNIHNTFDLPNADSCEYFDVDFISNLHQPIMISVPVGNESMGIPVFIVTLLVAWAAAAYLIFAVLKQNKRISKKVS